MDELSRRYQAVCERITQAQVQSGRQAHSVQLLAVSKTFPAKQVAAVAALGQRDFGENYVQEGVDKIAALQGVAGLVWHCIGPLQSNKTRLVAEHFDWVHSVDRLKIAQRLSEQRPVHLPVASVFASRISTVDPPKPVWRLRMRWLWPKRWRPCRDWPCEAS
jgi:pyridoxal phosphate enzyme (YggS family)